MTILRVPSAYLTIQEAIDVAVPGDVIVISEGDTALSLGGAVGYKETLDFTGKSDLIVRAAFLEQVNIQGNGAQAGTLNLSTLILDGAERVTFRDLCFYASSTTPPVTEVIAGYADTVCRSISFIDCYFRSVGVYSGTSVYAAALRLGAGSVSRPTLIRRCFFSGGSLGSQDSADSILRIEDSSGSVLIESNLFLGLKLATVPSFWSETSGISVKLTAPGNGDSISIRNNSARNMDLDAHWVFVDVPASDLQVGIYNNILDLGSGSASSYSGTFEISDSDQLLAVIQNNTAWRSFGDFSTASFVPDTSDNSPNTPNWSSVYFPYNPSWGPFGWGDNEDAVYLNTGVGLSGNTSHSYGSGVTGVGILDEGAPVLDILRLPFLATPSRGCWELQTWFGTWDWDGNKVQTLHAKYKNVDITNGMTITVGDSVLSLTADRRSYDSPFDVAKHLEILIGDAAPGSDIEFWYDPVDNEYQARGRTLFSIELSGFSQYLFGTGS